MINRRKMLGLMAAATLPMPSIARAQTARKLTFVPALAPTALDPIWTTSAVATNHGYYIYDTLYGVDLNLNPKPQMAEGHTVSDDGRTWTIKLRPGLKFHDNVPVRSIDCAESIKRWSARDTFGQVTAQAIDRYETPDDRTLVIKLKSPFPLLANALAKSASSVPFIMPERMAKTDPNKEISEHIGSGPYRFIANEFVSGSRASYRKFDGYVPRQEPADVASGGKVAYFEEIEWRAIPDNATAFAALSAGEIDWWELALPDMLPQIASDRNLKAGIDDPFGKIGILRFNSLTAPFNNAKLRAAVLSAVKQLDYMQAITANNPEAYRLCRSVFPCGTPYGVESASMSQNPDMEKAKQLVKASGYAGEKIVVLNASDTAFSSLGLVTFDILRKLGLNAELVQTDWGSVIQKRASREPAEKGGWSIFHTYVNGVAVADPASNLTIRGTGDKAWFGWYDSPDLEKLVAQWLSTADTAERAKIAGQIQDRALADAPSVPLGQYFTSTAHRANLVGRIPGPAPFPWGIRRG